MDTAIRHMHTKAIGVKIDNSATDEDLLKLYLQKGITNVISVPCSITDTWQSIAAKYSRRNLVNLIMSNHEGNLAGIAAGIFFGTGKPALIHMQNSGLFNAADSFVSFANASMYRIPMAVMVTYRGETSEDNSEPHQEIGKRTDPLVNLIFEDAGIYSSKIDTCILKAIESSLDKAFSGGIGVVKLSSSSFKKTCNPSLPELINTLDVETFKRRLYLKGEYSKPDSLNLKSPISRQEAILSIVKTHPNAAILFSNGYNARAAQAVADRPGNFYNVGYMGGTLAVGWGLAKSNKDIEVVVVDGDQNAQMSSMKDHLAYEYPENLHWYILNNHIGASVGTAESIPLSPQYSHLARIIETIPDEPLSFQYPRVKGNLDSSDDSFYTLDRITESFRQWILERN